MGCVVAIGIKSFKFLWMLCLFPLLPFRLLLVLLLRESLYLATFFAVIHYSGGLLVVKYEEVFYNLILISLWICVLEGWCSHAFLSLLWGCGFLIHVPSSLPWQPTQSNSLKSYPPFCVEGGRLVLV